MCLIDQHLVELQPDDRQQEAAAHLLSGVPAEHVQRVLLWFAGVFEQALVQAVACQPAADTSANNLRQH